MNKKKKALLLFILLLPMLLIIGLGNLIYFRIEYIKELDIRISTAGALNHMFDYPWGMSVSSTALLIELGVLAIIAAFLYEGIEKSKLAKHDSTENANRDAHFQTPEETEDFNKRRADPAGFYDIILCDKMRISMDNEKAGLNTNTILFAASGGGKTWLYVAPNIIQLNCNMILNDPSGELRDDYGPGLINDGYDVKTLNLENLYDSNGYNPFHYVTSEMDIIKLVTSLFANTTPPDAQKSDPIWENGEKILLEAFMLYIWHTMPKEKHNFGTVMDLMDILKVDEKAADDGIAKMFKDLEEIDPHNLAVRQWHAFKKSPDKTALSFVVGLGTRMERFNLAPLKKLTSNDEMDLRNFADTKRAIFLILPQGSGDDAPFNFIAALFYTQLFDILYAYGGRSSKFGYRLMVNNDPLLTIKANTKKQSADAKKKAEELLQKIKDDKIKIVHSKKKNRYEIRTNDEENMLIGFKGDKELIIKLKRDLKHATIKKCNKKELPRHVRMIMDEFANTGKVPGFSGKLATVRKYNISVDIILQSLAQLDINYKDSKMSILANCDSKLMYGVDDKDTLQYFSDMLGNKEVRNQSVSFNDKGEPTTSYQVAETPLMPISKMSLQKTPDCIVRVRSELPYFGKKYVTLNHPNYKFFVDSRDRFDATVFDKEIPDKPLYETEKGKFLKTEEQIKEEQKKSQEAREREKEETSLKEQYNSFLMNTKGITKDTIDRVASVRNENRENQSTPKTTTRTSAFEKELITNGIIDSDGSEIVDIPDAPKKKDIEYGND